MRINNWKYWQRYFLSHPWVIGLSLTPQHWMKRDRTFDPSRLCIRVDLAQEADDKQLRALGLPSDIEGYPVQYVHPGSFPKAARPFALRGDSGSLVFSDDGSPIGLIVAVRPELDMTVVCKASNIEKLLGVSFTPPEAAEYPRTELDPTAFPRDPKDRFDVLISGISIGHPLVTAGTLGGFVWDNETGDLLGLTCAHIAAPPGAREGDPIYQPGPLDIRTRFCRDPGEQDIAGHLVRWHEISFSQPNLIDAGVFKPTRPVLPDYVLLSGKRNLNRPKA